MDTDAIRVMAYSHDGFGLGHLRRNTTIASRFVREVPGSSVLMLVGCPSGAFFELPAGVDFIKVPSVIKVDTGVWHSRSLQTSEDATKALRAAIIKEAAAIFRPHLLLVDHIPTGVWGELLPTLRMLKKLDHPSVIVLGIRDILDAPSVIRKQWQSKHTHEAISKYYDEVLVYGLAEVFDTASHYGLHVELAGRIRYCGYVCSEEPYETPEQTRAELRLVRDKLIVVAAGGGHDAYPMMRSCVEALHVLGEGAPLEAIFVTGPLMDDAERANLQQLAARLPVRVCAHVEKYLSYLNAADLVITMAGYNSMCEILRLGKKALVVPRSGPSAEQMMRARVLAERGLIDVMYPDDLSPEKLAQRILIDLERTDYPRPGAAIPAHGSRQAVMRLLELIRVKAQAGKAATRAAKAA